MVEFGQVSEVLMPVPSQRPHLTDSGSCVKLDAVFGVGDEIEVAAEEHMAANNKLQRRAQCSQIPNIVIRWEVKLHVEFQEV